MCIHTWMRWFSFTLPASHWGVWTSFNYEWITSKTLLKLSHGYTWVNPAYNALLCGHRSKDFRAFGENVLDDIFYYLWEVQTMEVNPETARNARPLVIIKFLECSNKNDTLLVCMCEMCHTTPSSVIGHVWPGSWDRVTKRWKNIRDMSSAIRSYWIKLANRYTRCKTFTFMQRFQWNCTICIHTVCMKIF